MSRTIFNLFRMGMSLGLCLVAFGCADGLRRAPNTVSDKSYNPKADTSAATAGKKDTFSDDDGYECPYESNIFAFYDKDLVGSYSSDSGRAGYFRVCTHPENNAMIKVLDDRVPSRTAGYYDICLYPAFEASNIVYPLTADGTKSGTPSQVCTKLTLENGYRQAKVMLPAATTLGVTSINATYISLEGAASATLGCLQLQKGSFCRDFAYGTFR